MPHQQTTIQTVLHLYSGPGIAGALQTGERVCKARPWYCTVLSLATLRNSLMHSTATQGPTPGSLAGRPTSAWSAGTPKRWLNRGRNLAST